MKKTITAQWIWRDVKMLIPGVVAAVCWVLVPCCNAEETPSIYHKILVVGDSITKHGPAVAELGWSGQWGMAASSEDKDYVHLFIARLTSAQNGATPELMIAGGGGGKLGNKLTQLSQFKEFSADLAIVQMGENDSENITVEGFQKPYEQILEAIRAGNPKARIFCFGVWAPPNGSATKDEMIQEACKKLNATFVSLSEANANPLNKAGAENRFTNSGVNWHPGDKGMQVYADALWAALSGKSSEPVQIASPELGDPGVLFTENWDGSSGLKWAPSPKIESVGERSVLTVSLTREKGLLFHVVELPVEKIKGRKLTVETRIKGDSISVKPNPWNGVRIGLKLINAEGHTNLPQAMKVGVGSFDWIDTKWTYQIPDNIVTANLILGLDNVTGTVQFDSVKVSVTP